VPADGRRPLRVAERLREHLSRVLVTELGDPRLANIAVTSVRVTPDLGYGDVYVRVLAGPGGPSQEAVLRALSRAQGRLRRGLGSALGLKRVPELRFHYDSGPDARARVDQLLDEWRRQSESDDEG
jgi:ribosome-binding factor A